MFYNANCFGEEQKENLLIHSFFLSIFMLEIYGNYAYKFTNILEVPRADYACQ